MTSPLTQKILKLAEFDEMHAQDSLNDWSLEKLQGLTHVGYLVEGKREENARLTPLLTALAEVAEHLQSNVVKCTCVCRVNLYVGGPVPCETCQSTDALAKLAAVMGEIE